jgi:hypothetical protein
VPFARGPVLTYVGRGRYTTVGPTEYVGKTDVITIPSDFHTDLATIPRIFWAILPPNGLYERAAVLHDFGCVSLLDGTCTLTSNDVDGLFRRVIREEQELDKFRPLRRQAGDFLTRWVLWTGVRWGAVANPARRPGWARDAPLVLAITVAGLLATATTVYGLDRAAHYLAHLI